MPTIIAEPLHLSVLALCAIATAGIWLRAYLRYQKFLTLSLIAVLVAETMKSTIVTGWMADIGMHLVWRALVQTVCLLGLAFLAESIRASIWGVLWRPRRLYLRVFLVGAVGVVLMVISLLISPAVLRIENAGGVQPALFLALFSGSTILLCAQGLFHILMNRRESSLSLWFIQTIIVAFALDSVSLLLSFWLHGGTEGRDDGGVLWFCCITATLITSVAAHGWGKNLQSHDDERKVVELWRVLYERRGQGDPMDVLEQREWGGVDFTWIVIVRETADFLAEESRKVSRKNQNSASLVRSIVSVSPSAEAISEPRIINGWDELVVIANGLPEEFL
ncbi:hypothetical protein [Corynebacterium suicordis]|uniref:Uncharacterized protein n=1 Tax=Corynebacterium suicordis DSM 45110 TaxID=1121369 RepID=A0ABR9ZM75_9CORY|nr:hypothetical protein [Corynebacterium suicordis]MBF4554369.1 hypothetical protein [Corynebacterium suicordis DSM 45110]MDR6278607.1 hypothetical protein [Corynebacterium suicordis]